MSQGKKNPLIEIDQIEEAWDHICPNTLVVLDIDNTLMEPTQQLGSCQWCQYLIEEKMKQGLPFQDALDQMLPIWEKIQYFTQVQPVEENSHKFIRDLSQKNISFVGLTGRDFKIFDCTVEQLKSIDIHFSDSPLWDQDVALKAPNFCAYKDGVIFSGPKNNKGDVLLRFFSHFSYQPERIIFIDDQHHFVANVQGVMEQHSIPFLGMRYAGVDSKVKQFNPDIANLQMKFFNKILSDEAAHHLSKHIH